MTLSITMLCYYADCHYAECRCVEYRILFIIMPNVVMLSVIMLKVVMLCIVAPYEPLYNNSSTQIKDTAKNIFYSQTR